MYKQYKTFEAFTVKMESGHRIQKTSFIESRFSSCSANAGDEGVA